MMKRWTQTLPSMDRGRLWPGARPGHPRPHPATRKLRRTVVRIQRSIRADGLLLSPVMIFLSHWFIWIFPEITGEIFLRVRCAQARPHGNMQGEKALFQKVKCLILLSLLPCKIFSRKYGEA